MGLIIGKQPLAVGGSTGFAPIIPPDPSYLIVDAPLNGDFNDYSGKGNNLTPPTSPLFATIDGRQVMQVMSDSNKGFLDSINLTDYINNFRLEIEVNRISISAPVGQGYVTNGWASGINGLLIGRSGNSIISGISNNGVIYKITISNDSIPANKWWRFVLDFNKGMLKSEIIDIESASIIKEILISDVAPITSTTQTQTIIGGANSSLRYANAYLRNFKLYKYDD
jgi:hypothetical protein